MMIKYSTLILVLALSLFSCKKENMGDCFKSTGKISKESRIVAPFNSIQLDDGINLYISQSLTLSVEVEAGKNLFEHIKTKVVGNQLQIENNNKCNWVRSFKKDINVYIKTPNLKSIDYFGSGEVQFINTFFTDTLLVNMWEASGDLYLNFKSDYVELKSHTGTGTIVGCGTSDELICFLGGNGFINTETAISNRVLAVNQNTGYVRVNALQKLTANITSRGNIEYFGNPTIELNDTGKGELIAK